MSLIKPPPALNLLIQVYQPSPKLAHCVRRTFHALQTRMTYMSIFSTKSRHAWYTTNSWHALLPNGSHVTCVGTGYMYLAELYISFRNSPQQMHH